jgi:hypothetical protein
MFNPVDYTDENGNRCTKYEVYFQLWHEYNKKRNTIELPVENIDWLDEDTWIPTGTVNAKSLSDVKKILIDENNLRGGTPWYLSILTGSLNIDEE